MPSNLETELSALLNKYSQDQQSNTPDFLLAEFLIRCLAAWTEATNQRDTWYGWG